MIPPPQRHERGDVTKTMQAPDDPTVEARRQRDVTYWVDERNGAFPWPWWKLLPLVALVGAAAVAILTLIMIPIYENQVIGNAEDELVAAGIDPSRFNFDASYRDLDISGTLPEGVSEDDIRAAVEGSDGLRDLDLDFVAAPAPEPEPEPEPEPQPEPVVVETAPTDVVATISATEVVLTGEVPSERHRALLVEAASRNGAVTVVDELVVRDLDATEPGATARVLQLATLLGKLPAETTGMASITDDSFTSEIAVASASDAAALETAVGLAANAFPTNRTITIDTPDVDEEIETLQEQFDDLAIEIRENVTFETGSDVLNDTAIETLDKVVALMDRFTQPVVEISGHTDSDGNDDANLALSDLRAAAVRQYLIDAGIDGERIRSVGLGETEPFASNDTPEGRAQNRRVELTAFESFDS